jgi:biopolymer transport protein ExbB/TolQ/copper chaperone CopZ
VTTNSASEPAANEVSSFGAYYSEQTEQLRKEDQYAIGSIPLLAVCLIALLLYLESPWWVGAYIFALFGVAFLGLRGLRLAFATTQESTRHLGAMAKFLRNQPDRDAFLEEVRKNITPEDRSHVPEATLALGAGPITVDRVSSVARNAFRTAFSELNRANFLRAGLILGGLFGTVFFFAQELTAGAILQGDLAELLPGLRGALASTLTGILASLVIGLLASRLEHLLDGLVAETESFLMGPVGEVLATTPARKAVTTETDLWERLVEEVAELRRSTERSYGAMANDAATFSTSLEQVVDRLGDLPAVQIPPQLSGFQKVIEDFGQGMKDLHNTVEVLIPAVKSLGATLPLKIVTKVDALGEQHRELHQTSKEEITSVKSSLSGEISSVKSLLNGEIDSVKSSLTNATVLLESNQETLKAIQTSEAYDPTPLLARMAAIEERLEGLEGPVQNIKSNAQEAAWGAARLHRLSTAQSEALVRIESAVRADDDVRQALTATQAELSQVAAQVSAETTSLRQQTSSLEASTAAIKGASVEIRNAGAWFNQLLPAYGEKLDRIFQVVERVEENGLTVDRRLDPLLQWHTRIASAPLIRFLLWPSGKQVRVMASTDGNRHASSP